jgi:hypothetical protein
MTASQTSVALKAPTEPSAVVAIWTAIAFFLMREPQERARPLRGAAFQVGPTR